MEGWPSQKTVLSWFSGHIVWTSPADFRTTVYGAIIACILHFIVGALMASYGHKVDSIDGNSILTWEIESTSAAKGVIACCYIFVGVYGITWVSTACVRTY